MAKKLAPRAGRANKEELIRQGRLDYNASRGLDPLPNPEVGHAMNEESGMRAGLTPEKYHRKVLLSERRRKMNKEYDFVPELTDEEWDIYQDWLEKGGAKKMRAASTTERREQVQKAVELSKKHDKAGVAKVAAIPDAPAEAAEKSDGKPDDDAVNEAIPEYDKVDADAPDEETKTVGKKPGPKKGK